MSSSDTKEFFHLWVKRLAMANAPIIIQDKAGRVYPYRGFIHDVPLIFLRPATVAEEILCARAFGDREPRGVDYGRIPVLVKLIEEPTEEQAYRDYLLELEAK